MEVLYIATFFYILEGFIVFLATTELRWDFPEELTDVMATFILALKTFLVIMLWPYVMYRYYTGKDGPVW